MGFKRGADCKLYRNMAPTYEAPEWDEVANVRDLTTGLEKAKADLTTRASNRWRMNVSTLKDLSIEFQMVWDDEDDAFSAFLDAWLEDTPMDILVLDGAADDPGSDGFRATVEVMTFTRSEALEEGVLADVRLEPTYSVHPPERHTVAAS